VESVPALESISSFLRKRRLVEARGEKPWKPEGVVEARAVAKPKNAKALLEEKIAALEEELAGTRVREALYKKLIERYAEAISAGEEKTVPELRALINAGDEAVQEARKRILEELSLHAYAPEKHFMQFAEKAFEVVSALRSIHASISVSYWLSPKEILELGAADAFDKAVFLCSLLQAGGNKSARVRVVELEGGMRHALTLFDYNGRTYAFDAGTKTRKSARSLAALLDGLRCGDKRVTRSLYEFNDGAYEEFGE
jgi:hypothetical protein